MCLLGDARRNCCGPCQCARARFDACAAPCCCCTASAFAFIRRTRSAAVRTLVFWLAPLRALVLVLESLLLLLAMCRGVGRSMWGGLADTEGGETVARPVYCCGDSACTPRVGEGLAPRRCLASGECAAWVGTGRWRSISLGASLLTSHRLLAPLKEPRELLLNRRARGAVVRATETLFCKWGRHSAPVHSCG